MSARVINFYDTVRGMGVDFEQWHRIRTHYEAVHVKPKAEVQYCMPPVKPKRKRKARNV